MLGRIHDLNSSISHLEGAGRTSVGAADQRLGKLELEAGARPDRVEHAHGFGRHLGADAVAGQHDDALCHDRACS